MIKYKICAHSPTLIKTRPTFYIKKKKWKWSITKPILTLNILQTILFLKFQPYAVTKSSYYYADKTATSYLFCVNKNVLTRTPKHTNMININTAHKLNSENSWWTKSNTKIKVSWSRKIISSNKLSQKSITPKKAWNNWRVILCNKLICCIIVQ